VFRLALRLRLRSTASTALALVAVLLIVGALFPAVGDSFGKLHLPKGVSDLLGGADYSTITGWYRAEIASFYGPLVIAAVAITGAVATTAGEEEDRILAVVLAHPVTRGRLVAAKAGAVAAAVVILAISAWVGLVVGVAIGGGGIGAQNLAAFSLHLAFFGLSIGAVALALGAGTGRRGLAAEVAAAVALGGWLINGFAPLVDAISWLKYLSPYYYYAHNDPLANGVAIGDLIVLGLLTAALTAVAIVMIERRDLRG
jgi:ABC-2 type transport system permease protein